MQHHLMPHWCVIQLGSCTLGQVDFISHLRIIGATTNNHILKMIAFWSYLFKLGGGLMWGSFVLNLRNLIPYGILVVSLDSLPFSFQLYGAKCFWLIAIYNIQAGCEHFLWFKQVIYGRQIVLDFFSCGNCKKEKKKKRLILIFPWHGKCSIAESYIYVRR